MKKRTVIFVDLDQEALDFGRVWFSDGYSIHLPGSFVHSEHLFKSQDVTGENWQERVQKLCAQKRTSLLNPMDKVVFVEYDAYGVSVNLAYVAKGILHLTDELAELDENPRKIINSLSLRDRMCFSWALFKENIKRNNMPALSVVRNYEKIRNQKWQREHRLNVYSH